MRGDFDEDELDTDGVCPGCYLANGGCICFEDTVEDGCWRCHGEGGWHDCGEDSCCCGVNAELVNEDWVWCPECTRRG